jgi:hypothetical protein
VELTDKNGHRIVEFGEVDWNWRTAKDFVTESRFHIFDPELFL